MNNTVSFPNMPDIEEQAALWLAALDRGLSSKENQKLEQWIDEHPVHAETLVKFASMWDELDVLKPISYIMPLEVQHINTEAEQEHQKEKQSAPNNGGAGGWGWALAASTVFIALLFGVNLFSPDNSIENQSVFYANYQTEIGENSDVKLPDGSVLKLNTDTSLTVVYSENERRVLLHQGEAHFDVAENKDYPFKTIVGSSTVTAIGTAFNIHLDKQQQVEVTVTEGRVLVDRVYQEAESPLLPSIFEKQQQVQSDDEGVFLEVGEMAVIGSDGEDDTRVLDEDDMFSSLAWHQGMIIFQGETLTEVIEEVSRYTTVKFEIVDETIASTSVGGYFKTGDVDQLLAALEQNFQIPYVRRGNRVKLGVSRK